MTVKEIVSNMKEGAMIKIRADRQDKYIAIFSSEFWDSLDPSILALRVTKIWLSDKSDRVSLNPCASLTLLTQFGRPIYVRTLKELQAAIADNNVTSIALAADIEAYNEEEEDDAQDIILLDNGMDKALELNGHVLKGRTGDSSRSCTAIHVKDGRLWITGNGSVHGGTGCHDNAAVWADGEDARVTIEGGVYNVGVDAGMSLNSTIYASGGAQIRIVDGQFLNEGTSTAGSNAVLNIKNRSWSRILCQGGTFAGQDPAAGDDEDTETGGTFVSDGYRSVDYGADVFAVIPR